MGIMDRMINAVTGNLDQQLIQAVKANDLPGTRKALEAGADPNAREWVSAGMKPAGSSDGVFWDRVDAHYGNSAAHFAVKNDNPEILKTLFDAGAKATAPQIGGRTLRSEAQSEAMYKLVMSKWNEEMGISAASRSSTKSGLSCDVPVNNDFCNAVAGATAPAAVSPAIAPVAPKRDVMTPQ